MSKKATDEKPLIQAAQIRLSADETRTVLRVLRAEGKPVEVWGHQGGSLIEIGLMRLVPIPSADIEASVQAGWKKLRAAVISKDLAGAGRAFEMIRSAKQRAEKRGLILTELGKRVAAGLTVRLGRG